MHRALARAFDAGDRADPEAVAHHWLGAGETERAARHWVLAGRRAVEALAFHSAAAHLGRALDLGEWPPEMELRLRIERAEALTAGGALRPAADAFLDAAGRAPPTLALPLRRRALEQLLRAGEMARGMALAREVMAEVGVRLPASHARALAEVGARRAWLRLRGLGVRPRADTPLRTRLRLDTCWSVSSALLLLDQVLGSAAQTRYLLDALRFGEPLHAALALAVEAGNRAVAGPSGRDEVGELGALAVERAAALDDPYGLAMATSTWAVGEFVMGNWEACERRAVSAATLLRDRCVGARWELDLLELFYQAAMLNRGKIRAFRDAVYASEREAREQGDAYLLYTLHGWRGHAAWLVDDRPAEARRLADAAHGMMDDAGGAFHYAHYYELLAQAQIDLYVGDGLAAWRRIDAVWPRIERSLSFRAVQFMRVESRFLRARAALAAAVCDPSHRDGYLREARAIARTLERERAPWSRMLAALVRAGAASADGDAHAAVVALEVAAERGERAGMLGYAATAHYRRGRLRGGYEGDAESRRAEAFLRAEAVAAPARFTAMLAPGAWRDHTPG
jgi:hypothetical protein